MNAITFFSVYEKFVRDINFVVQTVKANNSTSQFTNAQKAAVIAGANTAIDELNDMREAVYLYTGFTVAFPAYDNTAAGNAGVFTPTYADVNSLRISFSELIAQIKGLVTENQGMEIADSYSNTPTYTKSSPYLTSEAAAITAIAAINTGLFV